MQVRLGGGMQGNALGKGIAYEILLYICGFITGRIDHS